MRRSLLTRTASTGPSRWLVGVAAVALTLAVSACSSGSGTVDTARPMSATAGVTGGSDPSTHSASHPGGDHGSDQDQKIKRGQVIDLKEGVKRVIAARRAAARAPFVVASLNVLGASHTAGAQARRGYGSGPSRIIRLAGRMAAKNVSVAGLQEFQPPQVLAFQHVAGAAYDVYPGLRLGARASDNSIAWRTSDWTLVEARTIGIPYFFGRIRPMPYILLKNRYSGKEVWFMNFHNPANIGGNMARWRHTALTIEGHLVATLHASGTPVVLTGDMNDRGAFVCPFTSLSGMHAANGAHSAGGRCYSPPHMDVDWVLGTPDLAFTDFLSDDSTRAAHLTDHPMITASVKLP